MSTVTDTETYFKNKREQYEALGQFVEAFERLVNQIRNSCGQLASSASVPNAFLNIILHHRTLTAQPLFDIFRATVGYIATDERERKTRQIDNSDANALMGVLKRLASEMTELVDIRNNLIHGTWYIGMITPDNPSGWITLRL
jgi:hypothetical protein